MSWRRAFEADAWTNLAVEASAVARSLRLPPVVADPPWELDPVALTRLTILWPRRTLPVAVAQWLAPLREALGRRVRVQFADIPQPVSSVVLMKLCRGGDEYPMAIDVHDLPSFRDENLVRSCIIYFKMQYQRGGYDIPNVVPGGYLPDKPIILRYLPYLRQLRDRQDFSSDVYGRFGLRFAGELRRKTLHELTTQQRFVFGGSSTHVSRSTFLKESAQARVCISLPGQGELCFRTISYLAMGTCMVGPRPRNELPAPLIDGVHAAWTNDDQSDLLDVCQYYVRNDDARERIVSQSRRYFEQYLHPDSLATYYLRACLDRLGPA